VCKFCYQGICPQVICSWTSAPRTSTPKSSAPWTSPPDQCPSKSSAPQTSADRCPGVDGGMGGKYLVAEFYTTCLENSDCWVIEMLIVVNSNFVLVFLHCRFCKFFWPCVLGGGLECFIATSMPPNVDRYRTLMCDRFRYRNLVFGHQLASWKEPCVEGHVTLETTPDMMWITISSVWHNIKLEGLWTVLMQNSSKLLTVSFRLVTQPIFLVLVWRALL
jgi:hypothetical protein